MLNLLLAYDLFLKPISSLKDLFNKPVNEITREIIEEMR